MKKLLVLFIGILLSSCSSQYFLSTYNGVEVHDPLYGSKEVILQVPSTVEIDTLSYSQLKWKLRTDSRFRYDFAQYAMDQPYSWYTSNYSFSYWRPYTSFDIYWNRYQFWNDWAFNYPYNYGWNSWNSWSWHNPYRPWWYRSYNPWNNWYNGPFNNPGYNVAWNSSRENNNIAYINGPRSSRGGINIEEDGNNIVTRYNKRDIDDNNQNSILTVLIDNLKNRYNSVRVYNNVDEVPININNNNNGRPIIYNNNNSKPIRGSWKPSNNSNDNNSYKPVYNNSNNSNSSSRIYTRPTGNSSNTSTNTSNSVNKSGDSSRGGNSNKRN